MELASRSAISHVAKASNVFVRVPGGRVHATHLIGQMEFRPATATIIAIVVTHGSLACNTVISREAIAGTGSTIARTLI